MSKAESRFRRAQEAKRKKRAITPSPQLSAPTDTRGLRASVGERLPETCRHCGTANSEASDIQGGLCSSCRYAAQRDRWAD
jgi:hypothetical protein